MKKWIFPGISTLAAVIVSILTYSRLPENMIVHFNASEMPDNWISKPLGAFLLPVLILFVSLVVIVSAKFEKDENKRHRMEATIGSVIAIISTLLLAVHLFIIAYNLGYELGVAVFATVTVGAVFVFLGNLIPRLPQGSTQWPKLPETLQRKASRLQGRLMMVFGLCFILLSVFPGSFIFPAFFFLLAVFIIILIISTIRYTRSR